MKLLKLVPLTQEWILFSQTKIQNRNLLISLKMNNLAFHFLKTMIYQRSLLRLNQKYN
jgi:hypothetical protein